jgi:UDPglucose 6-dehydrogenase
MIISIIGLGFVGGSMYKSFINSNIKNIIVYDKYKDGGIGTFNECLKSNILFMVLPTPYSNSLCKYDKSAIFDVCEDLNDAKYNGIIVIKSTIEPETTHLLSEKYKNLQFIHNPEFLTARTAYEDFHNQTHIVLGKGETCTDKNMELVKTFYSKYYSKAKISVCSSNESETMKIFTNCFYSVKIQFFNELYKLCKNIDSDYDTVKDLMLMNGWINPMHTNIPGPDGLLSYGGLCFPKDTNALLKFMKEKNSPHKVLEATITERNEMRKDHDNCN